LRQLVILERGFPVATKIIVGGEQLDVQNAPALLDEILGLETSWQAQLNTQPRNDSSHTHVIAAFERLNVPFLSGWEAAEVEIRDALAAGEFDDLATWRDEASGSSSDLWLVTMLGGNEGAAKAKALVAETTPRMHGIVGSSTASSTRNRRRSSAIASRTRKARSKHDR
jgi:hypothetical protein